MFEGTNVLVIGLGLSGVAASRVLLKRGARVVAIDRNDTDILRAKAAEISAEGVTVLLGVETPESMKEFDLVVPSPGVPPFAPALVLARRLGLRVISELELGWKIISNPVVAVTGTNGKTTTTKLISEILSKKERPAVACGNIGTPLCDLNGKISDRELLVVEASSFQLQNIEDFKPDVAVVLNVASDHLDWHKDFAEYFNAKARIVENQGVENYVIYNASDKHCSDLASKARSKKVPFSLDPIGNDGIWSEQGWLFAGLPFFRRKKIMPLEEIPLPGVHGVMNTMAAVGAALAIGESVRSIRDKVSSFTGLEHRMEYVTTISGVVFYNDSKATNPHATIHAVRSFKTPMVVILGGRNKGLDFSELVGELVRVNDAGILAGVVLMGECAAELEESLQKSSAGGKPVWISRAKDLEEAVLKSLKKALEVPKPGVVLFSPAAASFDMFKDYKDRGLKFKETVFALGRRFSKQ